MRDLCESAKQGHLCPDDLCHGNPDNTLCGFSRELYDEITRDMDDSDPDDYEERMNDDWPDENPLEDLRK